VRSAIEEWNTIHSADRHLILQSLGWETHSTPYMGDRPQAIINKQVLQGCDLLIAMFWTRLGSPTGKASSGTVEEIEEHLRNGKPVMLYFSNAPVRLDSVDDTQYKALKEFRASCEQRGLVESFDSIDEFREKIRRQLPQTIIRVYCGAAQTGVDAQLPKEPLAPNMTDAAKSLLVEAAKDRNGTILRIEASTGLVVQTNRKQFVEQGNVRNEALWKAAIRELVNLGLLEQYDERGDVFQRTFSGHEVAGRLKKS
jgi:hypothetical protein